MKRNTRWGAAIEIEAVDGTRETIDPATDAIALMENPGPPESSFSIDGDRGRDPATGRPLPRGLREGRTYATELQWLMRGKGAAYIAADASLPWVDAFRLCGMQPVVDTTPGSESITLAMRTDDLFEGGSVDVHPEGETYQLTGAKGTFKLEGQKGGPTKATFEIQGIPDSVGGDAALPALTYPNVIAPNGSNIGINFGDFLTANVEDWSFVLNATINPATNINVAGAHGGLILELGLPELEVTIASPTLVGTPYHTAGGLNVEELLARETGIPISLDVGSVQYNRHHINLLNAQLADAGGSSEGAKALRDLKFTAPLTQVGSTSDFTIVSD